MNLIKKRPMLKRITLALFMANAVIFLVPAQDTLRALNLEEVVITGSKVAEKKDDIPQQIDLVLSGRITQLSPQTSADAIAKTGAAYVQKSQQGGGSPVIRGFEANKILLVVDGVRMNNAVYRAGHLQNSITTDPNMMERIEVLKGAGSVVYGTDALGGVIAFYTRRPMLSDSAGVQPSLKAFVRYASANEGKTVHGSLNLGGKKWASLTGITLNDFGDLRSGARDIKNYPGFGNCYYYVKRIDGQDVVLENSDPLIQRESGYKQLDFLQKFLFVSGKGDQHTLNFQLSTTSNISRYDRLQTFAGSKPRFAEWYYGPEGRILISYEWQKGLKKWWADLARLTPAVQLIEESRNDRALGKDILNSLVDRLKIYSVNFDLFRELGSHELRYGAELVHNSLNSTGTAENITTSEKTASLSRYPNGTYSTAGVYFSHSVKLLNGRLHISDGMRFSSVLLDVKFDSRFFDTNLLDLRQKSNSQNLFLGGVATLPANFRLSAMFSTGFRNPNIDDSGKTFVTNENDLTIPNPDLRPEQVFYREVGLTKNFGEAGYLSTTAFVSNLNDAIVVRPFQFNGQDSMEYRGNRYRTLAKVNTGKARIWGISGNAHFKLHRDLTLQGNISYTKGRDLNQDTPLDHISPLYGMGSLAYEKNQWQFEVYYLFNGWKKIEDYAPDGEDNLKYATPDGTPAWHTWNFRASWQLSKRFRVQAAVENLADLRYRTFASGINAPGRSYILSLHYE